MNAKDQAVVDSISAGEESYPAVLLLGAGASVGVIDDVAVVNAVGDTYLVAAGVFGQLVPFQ